MLAKINSIETETIPNQLETMATKLNDIENRHEPVYAFRVTSVKDAGSSRIEHVSKYPGKIFNRIIIKY